MRLIDEILNPFNLNEAMLKIKANKGASGIDKITTKELPINFNIKMQFYFKIIMYVFITIPMGIRDLIVIPFYKITFVI